MGRKQKKPEAAKRCVQDLDYPCPACQSTRPHTYQYRCKECGVVGDSRGYFGEKDAPDGCLCRVCATKRGIAWIDRTLSHGPWLKIPELQCVVVETKTHFACEKDVRFCVKKRTAEGSWYEINRLDRVSGHAHTTDEGRNQRRDALRRHMPPEDP